MGEVLRDSAIVSAKEALPAIFRVKISDIQFLRAIAIILVLIEHLSISTTVIERFSLDITDPGWVGVELFFVISGFVVIRSFSRSGFDISAFAIHRLFRLYPALIAILAACLLINAILPYVSPDYALANFYISESTLALQSASALIGTHPHLFGYSYTNGPLWSLSKEFQFYAFLGVFVLVLKTITKDQRKLVQLTAAVAIVVYALGCILRCLFFFQILSPIGHIMLEGRFDFIALGVVVGLLPRVWISSVARRLQPVWLLFLVGPILMVTFARGPNSDAAWGDLLESAIMIAMACSFALLVIIGSEGYILKSFPSLARQLFDAIGDRSYSIYILHMPVLLVTWYVAFFINHTLCMGPWTWPIVQAILGVPYWVWLRNSVTAKSSCRVSNWDGNCSQADGSRRNLRRAVASTTLLPDAFRKR